MSSNYKNFEQYFLKSFPEANQQKKKMISFGKQIVHEAKSRNIALAPQLKLHLHLGYNMEHSKTYLFYQFLFDAYNLSFVSIPFETTEEDFLQRVFPGIKSNSSIVAATTSTPTKKHAYQVLKKEGERSVLDETSRIVEAIVFLCKIDGKFYGFAYDGEAAINYLQDQQNFHFNSKVVLMYGFGPAARETLATLGQKMRAESAHCTVYVIEIDSSLEKYTKEIQKIFPDNFKIDFSLSSSSNIKLLKKAAIIMNFTGLGKKEDSTPINQEEMVKLVAYYQKDAAKFKGKLPLFWDANYRTNNPKRLWETLFMHDARNFFELLGQDTYINRNVISGLGMALYNELLGFQEMTGIRLPQDKNKLLSTRVYQSYEKYVLQLLDYVQQGKTMPSKIRNLFIKKFKATLIK